MTIQEESAERTVKIDSYSTLKTAISLVVHPEKYRVRALYQPNDHEDVKVMEFLEYDEKNKLYVKDIQLIIRSRNGKEHFVNPWRYNQPGAFHHEYDPKRQKRADDVMKVIQAKD